MIYESRPTDQHKQRGLGEMRLADSLSQLSARYEPVVTSESMFYPAALK